jgi:hypothetical protein
MRQAACLALTSIPLLVGCVFAEPPDAGDGGTRSGVRQLTVKVRAVAGASGKLTANGADCSSGCTLAPDDGTPVTFASPDSTFQSLAIDCPGTGCKRTTSNPLVVQMVADHVVEATFRPPVNYMFVTSVGLGAAMGGLAGGDAHCKARAAAAGLGGTRYVAWLTTTAVSAASRLGVARGWIRPDGLPFADSVAAIQRDETFYPPRIDEFGNDIAVASPYGFIPVWSGTWPASPTFAGHTCEDWSSQSTTIGAWVGNAASGVGWNWNGALYACEGWQLPVYCFETDYANPVSVAGPPPGSRIAFLARDFIFPLGGGIASADARCMADAAAAGVQGTFKALIADIGRPAMDSTRFDSAGAPWYRRDGVPIVRLAADYLKRDGPILIAPIDLAADGRTHAVPMSAAWTGFSGEGDDYSVPGTRESTCDGWTSSSSSATGVTSIVDFTLKSYRKVPNWPLPACNQSASLYCLQQ